jgi:flagellum-specific peptidoglycan hydrolase FlgJ
MAYKEAKERGLENPEAQAHLAAAQSVEETGGGTSATARKNNAMFGIKKTQEGQGTAAGTGDLEDLAQAVLAHKNDNSGINSSRRTKEAAYILNSK